MDEQKKDAGTTTEMNNVQSEAREVKTNTDSGSEPVTEKNTSTFNKNIIFAFLAGVLLAFVGYFVFQTTTQEHSENPAIEGAVGFVDADSVVATVNGTKLSGEAFNQQLDQFAQLAGAPSFASLDATTQQQIFSQAVDALVNSELIAQAAAESGVAVSDEEVEAEYARLVEQVGGAEAAEERLASLNTTADAFKESLVRDMFIAKYLEAEVGQLVATEEELQEAYGRVQQSLGENAPSLEDVRVQLEAQVVAEKQQNAIFELLQQMREDADIEVLI